MKYANQKDLEYTFITKDGSIELSKFSLQHSDFMPNKLKERNYSIVNSR